MAYQMSFDDVKAEKARYSRQAAAILALLMTGPQTNRELYGIALNATARISELRKLGHRIDKERLGGGLYRYWLVTL